MKPGLLGPFKEEVDNMETGLTRRGFIRLSASAAAGVYFSGLFKIVSAAEPQPSFTFAYISDTHLYARSPEHRFIRNFERAIDDANSLEPQPDFILFGGDLAQLGQKEELELGKEILSRLKAKTYMMVGEHDWYLDMGEKWRELFGKDRYSFDHKGIHFVVLNSVIEEDFWTARKMSPMERMKTVAGLDNSVQGRFMVGEEQRAWLKDDLAKVKKDTPLIVFSHSPLYKYYRPWNFWTEDADEVQAILTPYEKVTVIHGHTHQVLTNRIKNITFHGMLSTAWSWPYAPEGLPQYTQQMDRADPFNRFDACGWGTADLLKIGQVDKKYYLWDRNPMTITYERVASGVIPQPPDNFHSGASY